MLPTLSRTKPCPRPGHQRRPYTSTLTHITRTPAPFPPRHTVNSHNNLITWTEDRLSLQFTQSNHTIAPDLGVESSMKMATRKEGARIRIAEEYSKT